MDEKLDPKYGLTAIEQRLAQAESAVTTLVNEVAKLNKQMRALQSRLGNLEREWKEAEE